MIEQLLNTITEFTSKDASKWNYAGFNAVLYSPANPAIGIFKYFNEFTQNQIEFVLIDLDGNTTSSVIINEHKDREAYRKSLLYFTQKYNSVAGKKLTFLPQQLEKNNIAIFTAQLKNSMNK